MKYDLISTGEIPKLRCHYFGTSKQVTSKQVKYKCSVYNPIADTKHVKIYVCNRCSEIHNEEIIDIV